MNKEEATNFANYCIYTHQDEKTVFLAVCDKYENAKLIAMFFAYNDEKFFPYYVSDVKTPCDFVAGGGWYECFQKDKETGKVKQYSLG